LKNSKTGQTKVKGHKRVFPDFDAKQLKWLTQTHALEILVLKSHKILTQKFQGCKRKLDKNSYLYPKN
jgi:hypothetical protein